MKSQKKLKKTPNESVGTDFDPHRKVGVFFMSDDEVDRPMHCGFSVALVRITPRNISSGPDGFNSGKKKFGLYHKTFYLCILNQIKMSERITEILDKCDLNWTVRTEPIQTMSGIPINERIAIVREDTNMAFSEIMSDGYYPYQNHELMELLDKVSNQTGLEIRKGGHFKGGARVYIQLKSNNLTLNGDKIEGYLTGINSFDGSTSLAFGPSNITISCMNTFFAAFREMNSKVRHTKNMVMKVDEICRRLEGVLDEERKIYDNIVRLSETRFDDVIKDKVTKALFKIKPEVDLKDEDQVSSVTRNKLSRFYIDLNGEIQGKGDNLWGLFSGITKYTTHSLSKNDNTEAKMFGEYGKRELSIFNQLVEMV